MYTGAIIIGFIAAFLQSCSYVFSRQFVLRFQNPLLLLFYSHILMGILALLLLPCVITSATLHSTNWIIPMLVCNAGALLGQTSFFRTLREVEASRLSSLLGLKLLVLAGLSFLYYGSVLNGLQWLAVILCVIAAVTMNWSGGKIPPKACIWLFLALFGYSVSDMAIKELVIALNTGNIIRDSLTAVGLSYFFLSLMVLPMARQMKFRRRLFLAALPFACCWFAAMLFLFGCFGILGAVFGNVIQSSRGMISVVLSLVLAKAGYTFLQEQADRRVWRRRAFAALLMAGSIILFSLSRS